VMGSANPSCSVSIWIFCSASGISEDTIRFRKNDVASFLKSLRLQNDSADIGKVTVKEIHDYVIKTAKL